MEYTKQTVIEGLKRTIEQTEARNYLSRVSNRLLLAGLRKETCLKRK